MAPEMMKKEVKIGPSADIYSFGVVMWEVCSREKPWSELNHTNEIFKAVRDEKRVLKLHVKNDHKDVPIGYEDLMNRCLEYTANRRPLIDLVRVDLQGVLERAAEIDREKTAHLERTMSGSEETKSSILFSNDSKRRQSSEANRTSSHLRSNSMDASLQQGKSSVAEVEMI